MMWNQDRQARPGDNCRPLDEEMTELSILVPSWQVAAIEQAARSEGITMGHYMRRALQQALNQFVLPRHKTEPET